MAVKMQAVARRHPMVPTLRRWSCDAEPRNWESNGEPPPFVLWFAWVGVGRAVDEIGEGLEGGSLVWLGKLSIEVAKEDVCVGTDVSTSIPVELLDWEEDAGADDDVDAARPCVVVVWG